VIAGLWDVDDESTAALMDQLYAGLTAGYSPVSPDGPGPGQEGPGEPDEPLSRVRVLAGAPAGGDRDQLGTKGQVRNVAGVQLERAFRTGAFKLWLIRRGGHFIKPCYWGPFELFAVSP
jgi:hypothetical protein